MIVNFNRTAKAAFSNALVKGMAAPLMIFGKFELDKQPFPEMIDVDKAVTRKSIADDFAAISSDLARALQKI